MKRIIALLSLLLLHTATISAEDLFPHRGLYPKVATMELGELYEKRGEALIIDVRSSYEYDTLHIAGAQHLALDDHEFTSSLQLLRKTDKRPMVFYCNGHTCKKSYQAAQKAARAGVATVYAYDAGIFEWTKAHPDEAVLLGKSPVNPDRLIGKEKLDAHLLDPEEFGRRAHKRAIVLDIRDNVQKDGINLFPVKQHSVPLDNGKLKGYVDTAKAEGKTLLIYDAVGKQIRWLQYYLEEEGVTDYFFMKGGAKAFLNY